MKPSHCLLFLSLSVALHAVQPGDTLQQVIAEKGVPSGEMNAGEAKLLTYSDQVIKLRNNVVVEVKLTRSHTTAKAAAPASQPRPKPAPRTVQVSLPAPGSEWVTDANGAAVQAKAENRLLFMLFTGSDWCIWCKRLEGEILGTAEFRKFASERLVLLKLDFPKGVPQSDELKAQNRILMQKYGIRGFPTVIVLDAGGNVVRQMGYQKGGPGPFIQALQGL